MFELREGSCFPRVLVGVNVGLALVDGIIAVLAFCQVCFCCCFLFDSCAQFCVLLHFRIGFFGKLVSRFVWYDNIVGKPMCIGNVLKYEAWGMGLVALCGLECFGYGHFVYLECFWVFENFTSHLILLLDW